jgi:hypothetical protein
MAHRHTAYGQAPNRRLEVSGEPAARAWIHVTIFLLDCKRGVESESLSIALASAEHASDASGWFFRANVRLAARATQCFRLETN